MDKLRDQLNGKVIRVPQRLLDEVHHEGWRYERSEACLLIWLAIEDRTHDNEFRTIPDREFTRIIKDKARKAALKRWLEEHGWIEIEKTLCRDGKLRDKVLPPHYTSTGKGECKRYRALRTEEEVCDYQLEKHSALAIYSNTTHKDHLCISTRKVLDKLDLNWGLIEGNPELKEEINKKGRGSLRHSIIRLDNKLGSVTRGSMVKRLYSPWTGCKKIGRSLFTLHGEELVGFDLKASQPTIIGTLAEDARFVEHCRTGQFYRDVEEMLQLKKEDAKKVIFAYCYGKNRTEKARNKKALAVQGYIKQNFPQTHRFIWESKAAGHRRFNCLLQDTEADIFLNKILEELIQKDIPALTVHDCVYFMKSFSKEGKEIMRSHLNREILNGSYGLDKK